MSFLSNTKKVKKINRARQLREKVKAYDSKVRVLKKIKLGDVVLISRGLGTVRYVGQLHVADNTEAWLGVELHEPVGKNDGSIDGVRYFDCKPKFGVFVKSWKRKSPTQEQAKQVAELRLKMRSKKKRMAAEALAKRKYPSSSPNVQEPQHSSSCLRVHEPNSASLSIISLASAISNSMGSYDMVDKTEEYTEDFIVIDDFDTNFLEDYERPLERDDEYI